MSDFSTNWTKKEFKIYLFIYCAHADFTESKRELDFIKSRVSEADFDKMKMEFEEDNDHQSYQKIMSTVEAHGYTKDQKEVLLAEMKDLFMADNKFDVLEESLYRGLKRIFK